MLRKKNALRMTVGILLILFLFFIIPGFKRFVRDPGGATIGIFSRIFYSSKQLLVNPFTKITTSARLNDLQSENQNLLSENARLKELRDENTQLRQELSFVETTHYPLIVSRVIGRISEGGTTFLLLNRGSSDKVKIGAPVVVNGILIGKIVRVHGNTSIMTPLSATKVKTAATFAGVEKTAGIAEGELNTALVLQLIPKNIKVEKGIPVITSGLEPGIPRELLIGQVESVNANDAELFQTAYLRTPVELSELSIVSILNIPSEL